MRAVWMIKYANCAGVEGGPLGQLPSKFGEGPQNIKTKG